MYFVEKFVNSVISAFLFTLFLIEFFGSQALFFGFNIIFSFSLFVFLAAGTIYSYVLEFYVFEKIELKKSLHKYLFSILFFSLGGVLFIILFALFQGNILAIRLEPLIVFGILPFLLYLHLSILMRNIFVRLSGGYERMQ